MLKRSAAFLIALFILLSFVPLNVSAATVITPHYEHAVNLKLLGLLKGTGTGFELERPSSRAEGAVMLVRLLGKENYALQSKFSHPFKDVPSWADSYVGYMYNAGITTGVSADIFGSDLQISASQYACFVLRALNYSEALNDFSYASALDKASSIGLLTTTTADDLKNGGKFIRDTIVMISYNALTSKLKGSDKLLLDKLVNDDKVVSEKTAEVLGLYTTRLAALYGKNSSFRPVTTSYGIQVKTSGELTTILRNSIYLLQSQVKFDIRNYSGDIYSDFEQALNNALEPVSRTTGVADLVNSWQYNSSGSTLTLNITYRYTKTAFDTETKNHKAAIYKARHVAALLNFDMPDVEKELALHNYLVNNCSYDYAGYLSGDISNSSFNSYGALVLDKAVCQGYSEAIQLLSDLSGVECSMIFGKTYSSGSWTSHAWNIVKIDNSYYHLDATFDDPITYNGENALSYDYFNLTDAEIGKNHQWDKTAYPACTATKYSYANVVNLASAAN